MKLSLHSAIDPAEGARETTDQTLPVAVEKSAGGLVLRYLETTESGIVTTRLICREGSVRVERTGAVNSRIDFAVGKTHASLYEIPPYRFDLSVTTLKLADSLTETGGRLDILYDMELGGEKRRVHFAAKLIPEA